jgi:hypothetical protein
VVVGQFGFKSQLYTLHHMPQNVENAGQGSASGVAPETEILVTPEMIAAGVNEVFQISDKEVARVYRAMERAKPKCRAYRA